jgi:hypothetical protein
LALADLEQGLLGQVPGVTSRMIARSTSAFDPRLARLGRALGLLGDGDAVAGADQPREVAIRAHGPARRTSGTRLATIARRAWSARCRGRPSHLGVVEKQLEEIAHTIEEQRIAGLALRR